MIVHFVTARHRDVARWLDRRAAGINGNWSFPAGSEYLVLAYEYADHRTEFESTELKRLCGLLGRFPASGLCLELRRSKGRAAHDTAVKLAADLVREFAGVVQDISGEVFRSLADLEAGAGDRAAALLWPGTEPDAGLDRGNG